MAWIWKSIVYVQLCSHEKGLLAPNEVPKLLSHFSDVEPPVVDFCESPPIFLVQNSDDLAREKAEVEWDPPIFHDNSLKDVLGGYLVQIYN